MRPSLEIPTMTLHRDGVGFVRDVVKGRELANGRAKFSLDTPASRLIFNADSKDAGPFYQVVNNRTLQRLGPGGGPPDSICDERLRRSARIIAISGVLKPVTLYSEVCTAIDATSGEDVAGTPARFTLDRGKSMVAGSTGCGSFSGKYDRGVTRLRFTHIAVRKSTCTIENKRIANTFIDSLEKTSFYHLCCNTLELRDGRRELVEYRTSRV